MGYRVQPLNKVAPQFLKSKINMAIETFVLLDHMHPNSKTIFNRINKEQRQPITKLPAWRPYLQMTFIDEEGQSRTVRYKANSNEVYQEDQIKKGILANEKFLMQERDDLEFTNGVCMTAKPNAQNYLKKYPGFEGFKGICTDIPRPQYKMYDRNIEIKNTNQDFLLRLEVGKMVADLDLKGAQELLIRLNGSSFVPPDEILDAQNVLVMMMNEADEDGLRLMLKKDVTADEKATILMGRLIGADILKFDMEKGQVTKKRGAVDISIKQITADSVPEMHRLFSEYITSDAGKTLYQDLEKDLERHLTKIQKN